jgi:hypothetical protein
MNERWKPISGYEGRYEVSHLGRVRSVDVLVPYTHWRSGARLQRLKKGKLLPVQAINSGYLIVHLHKDNRREAKTVHRLVAEAFVSGAGKEVNHRDGVKTHNVCANLEWTSSRGNHDHAVDTGLNPQAVRVRCPRSGLEFPSINRACKALRTSPKTVRRDFVRIDR